MRAQEGRCPLHGALTDMMDAIKLTMLVKNMIECSSCESEKRQEEAMYGSENLILTGWGYVEYVAAAAATQLSRSSWPR